MNKIFLFFIILLTFVFISYGFSNKSKDEKSMSVINKYLEKIGGAKTLKNIKTYQSTGVWIFEATKMEYKNSISLPNKLMVSTIITPGFYEITVFNSGISKYKLNDSIADFTNSNAIQAYEIDSWIVPLAHLDKIASEVKFIENKKNDQNSVNEIFIQFNNGLFWNIFFDSKTGLIKSMITSSGIEIEYLKYKKVDKILFPSEFKIRNSRYENEMKLILDKIQYNIEIDESEFKI